MITLWDRFVDIYYPNSKHEEPPVVEQLKSLVDYEQYSKETISHIQGLSTGTYWLLRVHRDPVNEHIRKWLESVFGQSRIGAEKIISFEDFDSIDELVRNQHITAFKIIMP